MNTRLLFAFALLAMLIAVFSPHCDAYRDPETGTFITRDPAGFVDGPNMYTYVRQNPWSAFDPLGLQEEMIQRKAPQNESEAIERIKHYDEQIDYHNSLVDRRNEIDKELNNSKERRGGLGGNSPIDKDALKRERESLDGAIQSVRDEIEYTKTEVEYYLNNSDDNGILANPDFGTYNLETFRNYSTTPAFTPFDLAGLFYSGGRTGLRLLSRMAPKATLLVRIGKDANQVSHAFRHIDPTVDTAKATKAITDDLTAAASSMKDGLHIRKITVDGAELTYNAFKLPDGTINVGRITIPK